MDKDLEVKNGLVSSLEELMHLKKLKPSTFSKKSPVTIQGGKSYKMCSSGIQNLTKLK